MSALHRTHLSLSVALVVLLAQAGCGALSPAEEAPAGDIGEVSRGLSTIDCTESSDTGYKSGKSFPIKVVTVDGKKMEVQSANAYYVMAQAAAKKGVNLKVVSGFRTMAQQTYLYNCYKNCNCNNCNLAAKPGYCTHQSGHAVDLNTASTPGCRPAPRLTAGSAPCRASRGTGSGGAAARGAAPAASRPTRT